MKRILVTPLDWGLGHATRCIPVIRKLLNRSCEVMIAGSGASLLLLQKEFPQLTFFSLSPYAPKYPATDSMVWTMAMQLPKFLQTIRHEHDEVDALITQQKIDLVISDNRYGCWTTKVPCIFMTHQSNILMPKRFGWLAPVVRKLNQRIMNRFSGCWIPDYPGEDSMAGDLISFERTIQKNHIRYIGLLSRFTSPVKRDSKYDLLCIFSGPEPQRTMLENLVVRQLKTFSGRVLIVRGLMGDINIPLHTNAVVHDFMTSDDLQEAIESSEIILTRSGFSTVMDLNRLSARAIFIPTPGQTEQEYLAKKIAEQGIAYSSPQHEFVLDEALKASQKFSGFKWKETDEHYLETALDEALRL